MVDYGYKIGAASNTQVHVEVLLAATHEIFPPPQGMSLNFAPVLTATLDGQTHGDGFPQCTWEWDYLSDNCFNVLMAYLGSDPSVMSITLYITTRLPSASSYLCYETIMHRPVITEDCNRQAGGWRDVRIRFTHMVYVPIP